MPVDVFFPLRGEDVRAAKAVYADCPVSAECLDDALANHEMVGIWGGTSERERRRMRRTRARLRAGVT
ncbi:WhiB family transcriptional regulator, partial [Arthrospira platensis SPKY1]|nr:WhiB family transcriptional regulator [Arthrospira platensis SPKY1]